MGTGRTCKGACRVFLFVYYKFIAQAYPSIATQLAELETTVHERFPEVSIRLLRRPEADSSGQQTWMEMYEIQGRDLPGLQSLLSELVDRLGLPPKRAIEVFIAPGE
ncbi:hypothetical protein DBV39_07630 [Orrella marina]|uniref:DUF4936 domain-containing protein n=1 Tax=Orrella marina TaxID=2163011 RepID=A0A2R4XIH1_9BURK|nr:hypothetical protein DBV39_07630 [Orrella marina]